MGTNFYADTRDGETIHLGKRSHGWRFFFHATPHFDTLASLVGWLENTPATIRNEYGVDYNAVEFVQEATTHGDDEPGGGHRHNHTCWCFTDPAVDSYRIHGPYRAPDDLHYVDEASGTDWCRVEFC